MKIGGEYCGKRDVIPEEKQSRKEGGHTGYHVSGYHHYDNKTECSQHIVKKAKRNLEREKKDSHKQRKQKRLKKLDKAWMGLSPLIVYCRQTQ